MTDIEERVGRAGHERWKLWIIQGGYADHAFVPCGVNDYSDEVKAKFPDNMACGHPLGPTGCHSGRCRIPRDKHHPDMVPWEFLPEEKRGKYIDPGMAVHDMLQDEIYVPGTWICSKCGFTVIKNILYAKTGNVTVNPSSFDELCQNDGTKLERQTWKSLATEALRILSRENKDS